jgi:hypothetical protein
MFIAHLAAPCLILMLHALPPSALIDGNNTVCTFCNINAGHGTRTRVVRIGCLRCALLTLSCCHHNNPAEHSMVQTVHNFVAGHADGLRQLQECVHD